MSEVSITVNISDRPYKLMVKAEDEILFREAAVRINERLQTYAKSYAFKDRQDLLAMVALQYTSNALRIEKMDQFKDAELLQRLKQVDDILQKSLPDHIPHPSNISL